MKYASKTGVCVRNQTRVKAKKQSRIHCLKFPLPAQASVLQVSSSELSPWHWAPPSAGAGLVHERDLVFVPPPQDSEHSVKSVHSDHPPSTGKLCKIVK